MARFFVHWATVALGLGVTAWVLPGVAISSLPALLVAAIVLGFVNAIVRPLLVLLTLPITLLTLGLFYLVVNGFAFSLASFVVPGFEVRNFGWAMLGAVVVGIVSWFVSLFTGSGEKERRGEAR